MQNLEDDVRSHSAPQGCGGGTDGRYTKGTRPTSVHFRQTLELNLMPDEATLTHWKTDDSEWFSGSASRPDVRTRI